MSGRPGILVSTKTPADGGESPNRYAPEITVEVRVYWPPKATDAEIYGALHEVWKRANIRIQEERAK